MTSDIIRKREGSYEKRDAGVRLARKVESQEREQASRSGAFSTHCEVPDRENNIQDGISSKFLLVKGLPGEKFKKLSRVLVPRKYNITYVCFIDATTPQMLQLLFQQFPGFTCAELVDENPGTGLVEFDTPVNSSSALRGLQGFRLNATHSLVISFNVA